MSASNMKELMTRLIEKDYSALPAVVVRNGKEIIVEFSELTGNERVEMLNRWWHSLDRDQQIAELGKLPDIGIDSLNLSDDEDDAL